MITKKVIKGAKVKDLYIYAMGCNCYKRFEIGKVLDIKMVTPPPTKILKKKCEPRLALMIAYKDSSIDFVALSDAQDLNLYVIGTYTEIYKFAKDYCI